MVGEHRNNQNKCNLCSYSLVLLIYIKSFLLNLFNISWSFGGEVMEKCGASVGTSSRIISIWINSVRMLPGDRVVFKKAQRWLEEK